MSDPACPVCTLEDILSHADHWECVTCGHEWPREVEGKVRIIKDAHGNLLAE